MNVDFPPIPGALAAAGPDNFSPAATAARGRVQRSALRGPARPFADGFLPDGTELVLTMAAKALYRQACTADGAEAASAPGSLADALTLLFFCAHPPEHWNVPRFTDDGILPPLRADAFGLLAEIDRWADATFRCSEEQEVIRLAAGVWEDAHANFVVPVSSQKKTEPVTLREPPECSPLSTISSAGSSPAETPASGPPCETASPSATSTPLCTAGIPAAASPFVPSVPAPQQTKNFQP